MLFGTISEVNDHGSILSVHMKDAHGDEMPAIFGDARPMSHFLDAVIEAAEREGILPCQVEVAASGTGFGVSMMLAEDAPMEEEVAALV